MSSTGLTAETFCESLLRLSSEDRYECLKQLDGNKLFCEVTRLLPSEARQEFAWFEKRAELQACLKNEVSLLKMQQLIESGTDDLGPTSLMSLLDCWSAGDEFWLFDSTPGDKGYALVREGRILDYSIIEITSI